MGDSLEFSPRERAGLLGSVRVLTLWSGPLPLRENLSVPERDVGLYFYLPSGNSACTVGLECVSGVVYVFFPLHYL